MRVIVCVKQVLDPEIPASDFTVDRENKRVITSSGTALVVSTFDENAIECALRLKDQYGAEVFSLSAGSKLSKPVVKVPLYAGADQLFLVEDPALENIDSFAMAQVLAMAIRRIGGFDLVITGRQGADWDNGVTGLVLAELLGIPAVSLVERVEVFGEKIRVERIAGDKVELLETSLPCLITVTNELGNLRPITLPLINQAKKKPVTQWKLEELGITTVPLPRCEMIDLYLPVRSTVCRFIEAETGEEIADKLAEIVLSRCQA